MTLKRRPFIRFFACKEDLSNETTETPLPDASRGFLGTIKRANNHAQPVRDDKGAYLATLQLHGPMTYGAAAVALGWAQLGLG